MTAHMIAMQSLGLPPIVVALSDTSVLALRSGSGFVQTAEITATASGGNGGPYTYSWSRVSGDTEITAQSPSLATTRFQATVGTSSTFNADFKCTASDGARSGDSDLCGVTIQELS
jgi:hypothetical protein